MTALLIEPLLSADDLIPSVFNNRMGISRAVKFYGFPPGRLISPQCRRWTKAEVEAWIADRPISRPENIRKGRVKATPSEELAHA